MNRVKNKTCVITGAALGIGHACALRLAEEGARIAVFDVLDEDGARLVEALTARGTLARYWHVDVSNEAQVKAAMDEAAAHFGSIDVLVPGGHPNSPSRGHLKIPQ